MYVDPYSQQVISTDLVSQRLKRKKVRDSFAYLQHYLSFHPGVEYWLPMEQAQQWVDQGRTQLPHAPEYYESLLEGPFVALDGTPKTFSDLTEVKYYLKQRFSRVSSQQRMSDNRK